MAPVGFFVVFGLCLMAPKAKLTAALFQERYGALVSSEHADCETARQLRIDLQKRTPPIVVSDGVLKLWFQKQRIPPGALQVKSAEELQSTCGVWLPDLVPENATAYKLSAALKSREQPVYASDGILKQWLARYCDATPVHSAGHLELLYGAAIREHEGYADMDAPALRVWLRSALKVDASIPTCQTWRVREWCTAGRLMCITDIENAIGERLRLSQYRDSFTVDASAALCVALSEGQPAVFLSTPTLLREWHAKYHPDSGPLHVSTADELEHMLGDDLRIHYAGLKDRAIITALGRRAKPVLVSNRQVIVTWQSKINEKVSL